MTTKKCIRRYKVSDLLHAAANNWDALPKSIRKAYDRGAVLFDLNFIGITQGTYWEAVWPEEYIQSVSGVLYLDY